MRNTQTQNPKFNWLLVELTEEQINSILDQIRIEIECEVTPSLNKIQFISTLMHKIAPVNPDVFLDDPDIFPA